MLQKVYDNGTELELNISAAYYKASQKNDYHDIYKIKAKENRNRQFYSILLPKHPFQFQKLLAAPFLIFQIFQSSIIIIFRTNSNRNEMASIQDQSSSPEYPQRLYECACKKTYKSYPALYTHIKNKHDGKAPGNIKKPTYKNKKFQELQNNQSKSSIQTQLLSTKSDFQNQFLQTDYSNFQEPRPTQQDCISKIARILDELPVQIISRQRLHEVTAIIEMTVFMAIKKQQGPNKTVGVVLKKFFQKLTGRVEWSKFKQFYTLLMIFSQFILTKIGHKLIFQVQEPDIFCHFINQFVQNEVQAMINQFKVQNLLVFQRKTMLNLFFWFFQWMLLKQYTTYKVSFKQDIVTNFIY